MSQGHDVPSARVLIVEDEYLVAETLLELLLEMGCIPVGPAARVTDGVALAQSAEVDAAILDVNIAGEPVFPVADTLLARHVPFIFVTGYTLEPVLSHYPGAILLRKPYRPEMLEKALHDAMTGRQPESSAAIPPCRGPD